MNRIHNANKIMLALCTSCWMETMLPVSAIRPKTDRFRYAVQGGPCHNCGLTTYTGLVATTVKQRAYISKKPRGDKRP